MLEKVMANHSARSVRHFGWGWLLGSVAFAAFNPWWQVNILIAIFIFGIGIGLGNWEGGE